MDIPIFVAFPRFSDTAKKIAQGHNIILIEGSPDEPDNVARIKMEIQSRLNGRPKPSPDSTETGETSVKAQQKTSQAAQREAEEEEKKAQVQLFTTTSTIHPEPKKKSRFMKLLKGEKKEEDEE